MKLTYFGHACFGVQLGGKNVLFDPFISPNPLPEAKNINIDEIEADYIFISHGHEDHVADVESIAKRTKAKIVSNFEIVSWFAQKGFENNHPMNLGGNWSFEFGKVKYVNAIHSSVLPDGSYGGNPGGFVFSCPNKNFYFAGDTALTMDMKLIGEEFSLDFAVLPIGDNFTMGIDDAVKAANFVKCDKVVGIHYNTFGFIEINKDEAITRFKEAGKELLLPEIGKSIEL